MDTKEIHKRERQRASTVISKATLIALAGEGLAIVDQQRLAALERLHEASAAFETAGFKTEEWRRARDDEESALDELARLESEIMEGVTNDD